MKAHPKGWAFLCLKVTSFGKPSRIAKAKGEVLVFRKPKQGILLNHGRHGTRH